MRTPNARLAVFALVTVAVTAAPPAGSAADPAPPAPRAGCATFTDDKEDGSIGGVAPNDPDLDILDTVFASPPGKIRAYIRVEKLGIPEWAAGHQFSASFQLQGKPVVLFAGQDDPAALETVHEVGGSFGLVGVLSGVSYNGVVLANATLDVVWDTAKNTVIMTTDRAPIETAAKTSMADGVVVKEATAKSLGDYIYTMLPADTATGKTPEASSYTLGDNSCFAPPEGKLALTVPTSIVGGRSLLVSGVLSTSTGAPVAGKAVTVAVAGKTASVTSGANGAFSASFAMTTAGSYKVTATWAGDDSLKAVTATAPVTVKVQPTSTTLSQTVSGASVTVRSTLLTDLRAPLASQPVTWYVDGKAVGTYRTDSAGRTTLRTVRGKTVKAVFAGVRNRYAASSATRRT